MFEILILSLGGYYKQRLIQINSFTVHIHITTTTTTTMKTVDKHNNFINNSDRYTCTIHNYSDGKNINHNCYSTIRTIALTAWATDTMK